MNDSDVRSLVESELQRIADASRRSSLTLLLVTPRPRELRWEYARRGAHITCWIVAENLEAGVQLVYSREGFGPGDPWGVVYADDPSAGRDDRWFISLDDAFINSGLWDGELPPDYEIG